VLLETYEARAEAFSAEAGRVRYALGTGPAGRAATLDLYARRADLFTREVASDLVRATADAAARALAWFAADGYLTCGARDLEARLIQAVASAEVEREDAAPVPYTLARTLIANEPHPRRRRDLDDETAAVDERLNAIRGERLARLHELALDLDPGGYTALCDSLRGLELETLARALETIVEATDDPYQRALKLWLGRLGVDPDEARPADVAFLSRAPQFDAMFPAAGLMPAVRGTLARMGLDVDGQVGLAVEPVGRPGAPLCAPIFVPGEVKLILPPAAGYQAYGAALRAAGEAEHFLHVDPALPFPLRRLGDESVVEASGRLLGEWLRSPRWIRDQLGVRLSGAREYLELANFRKLYLVRQAIGRLRYELELHTGETGLAPLYAEMLTEHTGVQHRPEEYLADVSDGYQVAVSLRALLFEVQLRHWLEANAGENWFQRPEGAQLLAGLWRRGQSLSVPELAQALGRPGLELDPLIEDLLEPRD
jgi:hypothetical protein